jgi:PAS domain S-box-containing protein
MENLEAEKLIGLTRHVSEMISSPGDLQKALEATVSLLRTVLEAETCSIMLLDPQAEELEMAVSTHIERELWPRIKLRVGEGFAGQVAQSGRSLLVRDDSETHCADDERRRRYKSGSFMCVPMKAKGQTLGVINITNRKGGGHFSPTQLDMLASLANMVALAIENARLLASTETMSRRLRDVLEGIGDGVFAVDTDGVVLLHNEIALHYLGFERGRCVGRRFGEVIPQRLRAVFQELIERTLAERSHIHEEIEWTAGGSAAAVMPVTLSTTPLYRDARGKLSGVIFVIHDATLNHRLSELSRIDEAKNSFLAIVSHELRTPLTSIKGAAHLLRYRLAGRLEPENLELFKIVEQNSERLYQQIVNMLDVVNIENQTASLTLRPMDLSSVAGRCVAQMLDAAARRDIEIVEDYDNNLGPLLLDEEKISRAIGHLLDNAIKFTPRFGRITLATGRSDEEAYIAVRDTGTGVDPAIRDRIFRKFVQGESHLTRQSGGCGVGLFVARAFAEMHGGRIETANLEEGGCEFRLVLAPMEVFVGSERDTRTTAGSSNVASSSP